MQVGVIGLGAMGAPMARNFHKHGLLHAVWNRSLQGAEPDSGETGARIAKSPADLARDCDFISNFWIW